MTAPIDNLRRNIFANMAGRGWSLIVQVIATPIYIRIIGIEKFGLVGFFLTLAALSNLLDFGLSSALNRSVARSVGDARAMRELGGLIRSIEMVYVAIAVLIGALVVSLARPIASSWLSSSVLAVGELEAAVAAMGLALAAYWPMSLYAGGLLGLQRQVLLSGLTILFASIRVFGALVLLWLVTDSMVVFFLWHAGAALAQAWVLRTVLIRSLGQHYRAGRFRWESVRSISRFAGAMAVISMSALVFTQGDKVVLSRILPLEQFGYYTIAALAASGLSYLVLPVFDAVFPRFSTLVARGADHDITRTYHRAAQAISIVVTPSALLLAVSAPRILWAWTGSLEVVAQASTILSMLAIGTGLNGLMNVPYALMLAGGWTRLPLLLNLGAVVVLGPSLVVLATRYGALGAAAVWVALNALYVIVGISVFHRRALPGEHSAWLAVDVLNPTLAAALAVSLGTMVSAAVHSRGGMAIALVATLGAGITAASIATPLGRESASQFASRLYRLFGTR